MTLPSFHISEVFRIIGKRQQQSTYDMVIIVPDQGAKEKITANPILFSVPTTDATKATDVKGIPLKRIERTFKVDGWLLDGDDGSKLGVTTTTFDTDGVVSGGTAVSSIMKKKWILLEMSQSIAEPHTLQVRGVIIPTANPQTTPPTPPSDETKNIYHKMVTITSVEFDDTPKNATSPQSALTNYFPNKIHVTISFKWGPYNR